MVSFLFKKHTLPLKDEKIWNDEFEGQLFFSHDKALVVLLLLLRVKRLLTF